MACKRTPKGDCGDDSWHYLNDTTYTPKLFSNLPKEDDKFIIRVQDEETHREICLDIRGVISEVTGEFGSQRYTPSNPDLKVFYFADPTFTALVEKEETCLHSTHIKDARNNLLRQILPEDRKELRTETLIALRILCDVLLSLTPGTEIIANNLETEPNIRGAYKDSLEYTFLGKRAMGNLPLGVGQLNPFDASELDTLIKKGVITDDQKKEEDRKFATYSLRFISPNNRSRLAPEEATAPMGLARAPETRKFLDQNINLVKFHCVGKVLTQIVRNEGSIDGANKFLDLLRVPNSSQTPLMRLFGCIAGNECIRSVGDNFSRLINFLFMLTEIPQLNTKISLTVGDIPSSFTDSFADVQTSELTDFTELYSKMAEAEGLNVVGGARKIKKNRKYSHKRGRRIIKRRQSRKLRNKR